VGLYILLAAFLSSFFTGSKKQSISLLAITLAAAIFILLWEFFLKNIFFGNPASGGFIQDIKLDGSGLKKMVLDFFKLGFKLFYFAGLAYLPFFMTRNFKPKINWLVIVCVVSSLATFILYLKHDLFPFSFNIWNEAGTGPVLLKEIYEGYPVVFTFPLWISFGLTFLAGAGGIFLLFPRGISGLPTPLFPDTKSAMVLFLFLIYLPMMAMRGPFDRYTLPLLALIPVLFFRSLPHERLTASVLVSAIPLFLFSVFSVKEYLAWNDAKWKLIENEMSIGTPVSKMDGGFEFNGMYGFREGYQSRDHKSWWWVEDDSVIIGFNTLPGYLKTDSCEFTSTIPWEKKKIFSFSRISGRNPAQHP
jgi:hypothetical protein